MTQENTTPQTLQQLFSTLGLNLNCYDIGRHIQPIPSAVWQSFEQIQRAYPQPYMRHAWLALVIDDGTAQMLANPMLWFVRLPLDEFGLLEAASREHFMGAILHRLGRQMEQLQADGQSVDLLEDNPFVFTPSEDKLVQLHAILRRDLKLGQSEHYTAAIHYLENCQNKTHRDQWQQLELAGFADIAANVQQHQRLLSTTIPQLPLPVLAALCQSLENHMVNSEVSQAIGKRLTAYLKNDELDPSLAATLLRGFSQSQDLLLVQSLLIDVLSHEVGENAELLATLSSRFHLMLADRELCTLYLERLANSLSASASFTQLVAELLTLPATKPTLLFCLQRDNRSEKLRHAVEQLLQKIRAAD
ncbi:hypothetical protein SIN8267_03578 [Sinobacterium norvegicum]|uniref:DUF3549 family protein n=1 Tax=Sinobacterium norvegicum TaxID=1641715 RepID=A0ABM9AJL6_9GAMM|nr:DUF3549 family protein [Sinobacterium norvegicum]CAH0993429.1 hypothetical protein SIN8267_03578 [Sinobacterium norvegicum]